MSTDSISKDAAPRIRSAQIRLLEKLCNACAVSGDESEVRSIVLDEIRPHADQVEVDALGNILATRLGKSSPRKNRLRVMLAAHMDEIGFMLINRGSLHMAIVAGKGVDWIEPTAELDIVTYIITATGVICAYDIKEKVGIWTYGKYKSKAGDNLYEDGYAFGGGIYLRF